MPSSSAIWGPPPWTTTGREAHRAEQRHVLGERREGAAAASLGAREGRAAVLDDDDRALEPPDVRQRLDEDRRDVARLGGGDRRHEVVRFSSR